ncbi:hypothetical protein KUDE01_023418, partial [Dissostichus eleginoides]
CDTESDQDDKEEKEREHVHVTSATICTCQTPGTHTLTATVVICILWVTRFTLQKDGGEQSRFNGPVPCRRELPASDKRQLFASQSEESSVYGLEWVLARPRLRLIALEYPVS